MPASKGTKVFTTVREFEIADDYEEFRGRFNVATNLGAATIDGRLLDDTITFNIENIVAFIPMIDLSGAGSTPKPPPPGPPDPPRPPDHRPVS